MGTKVNGNKVRIKSLLLMVFRVQQPYKVRTFTTFLASPPWCSRYAVHNKVAFKTEVCNVFSSKKLFFFFFCFQYIYKATTVFRKNCDHNKHGPSCH